MGSLDGWLEVGRGRVGPEHIDYNGHMNVVHYRAAFDAATDGLFAHLRLGPDDYNARTGATLMVVEEHTRYHAELAEGERCRGCRRRSRLIWRNGFASPERVRDCRRGSPIRLCSPRWRAWLPIPRRYTRQTTSMCSSVGWNFFPRPGDFRTISLMHMRMTARRRLRSQRFQASWSSS
jgi:Thioesterase-like superfamily